MPLGPMTRSLVLTAAFPRVELGPELLREGPGDIQEPCSEVETFLEGRLLSRGSPDLLSSVEGALD